MPVSGLQSPVDMYLEYSSAMMPSSPEGLSAIVPGAEPMSAVYCVIADGIELLLSFASPLEMKTMKFFWQGSTIGLVYVCWLPVPSGFGSAATGRGLPARVSRAEVTYTVPPASALFLP